MADYVVVLGSTGFSSKDALISGNPLKKILGFDIQNELNAIATMSTTKEDKTNKGIVNGYCGLDANLIAQAGGINVTGTTVPANGWYLPSANTLGVATNTVQRGTINSTGAWNIVAPTAGTALTVNGLAAGTTLSIVGFGTSTVAYAGNWTIAAPSSGTALAITSANTLQAITTTGAGGGAGRIEAQNTSTANASALISALNDTSGRTSLQTFGSTAAAYGGWNTAEGGLYTGTVGLNLMADNASGVIKLQTGGNTTRVTIAAAGNVTIAAPSSGTTLVASGIDQAVVNPSTATGGTIVVTTTGNSVNSGGMLVFAANTTSYQFAAFKALVQNGANNSVGDVTFCSRRATTDTTLTEAVRFGQGGNVTIAAPSSGTALLVNYVAGGIAWQVNDGSGLTASLRSSAGIALLSTDTNNPLNIRTNSINAIQIDTSQNLIGRGIAFCKFKSGTTNRSTTTLANDPDLVYAIPAAGTYSFEVGFYFVGITTGTQGMDYNMNYSGTFTANSSNYCALPTSNAGLNIAAAATTIGIQFGTSSTNNATPSVTTIWGVLTATGTGTLGFSWAQHTASNSTTAQAGSYLKVTQLS